MAKKTNPINPLLEAAYKQLAGIPQTQFDVPVIKQADENFDTFDNKRIDPSGGINYEAEQDWLAQRDAEESNIKAWGKGIARASSTALTSAGKGIASLVTVPVGVINGTATGNWDSLYDNAIDNGLTELDEWVANQLPSYKSRRDEGNIFKQLANTDFWADKFMNGVGYAAGAYLSGLGLSKVLGVTKLAASGKALGAVETAQELSTLAKAESIFTKVPNIAKQFTIGTAMAFSESADEARSTKEQVIQDLKDQRAKGLNNLTEEEIEKIGNSAGNTSLALNLPVTGLSNVLLFRHVMPGFNNLEGQIGKGLKGSIGQLERSVPKIGFLGEKGINRLKRFGEGFIEEGAQEYSQLAIEKGTSKYYTKQYSPEATNFLGAISSIADSFINEFGSDESIESIFLGGIIGGPMQLVTGRGNTDKTIKKETYLAEYLNTNIKENIKNYADSMARASSYNEESAKNLLEGNKFAYENNKWDSFKSFVQGAAELKGTEVLKEQLKMLKDIPVDDFNEFFGYPQNNKITEEKRNQKVDELVSKVDKITEVHNTLRSKFPTASKPVFDALFDAAVDFEELDNRARKVSQDIFNLTSDTRLGVGEMAAKEYLKKGINFNTYKNTEEYKQALENFKQDNPLKASELEPLVEDLFSIIERKNDKVKQYNEAVTNSEKIEKETEEAKKKSEKFAKKEAENIANQEEKRKKKEEELTKSAAEKIANNQELTTEEKEVITNSEKKVAQKLAETPQGREVINKDLEEQKQSLIEANLLLEKQLEEADTIEEQAGILGQIDNNIAAIDNIDNQLAEIQKKKQEESKAKEKKQEKVDKQEAKKNNQLGNNSFTKTYLKEADKTKAQEIFNTKPVKDILDNLVIKVEKISATENYIKFYYNDVLLGNMPHYKTKLNGEPSIETISEQPIDSDTKVDILLQKALDNKTIWDNVQEGTYSYKDLPFLEVTTSLGEILVIENSLERPNIVEADLPIVINEGKPVIYDKNKSKFLFDNAPDKYTDIPDKLRNNVTGRYVVLINNGYQENWILLTAQNINLTEFESLDAVQQANDLQKEIKSGKKANQKALDTINKNLRKSFYAASQLDLETQQAVETGFIWPQLNDKGTFTLRHFDYKITSGKREYKQAEIADKKGVNTLQEFFQLSIDNNYSIKGQPENLAFDVASTFKNGGLIVTLNKEKVLENNTLTSIKEEKPVDITPEQVQNADRLQRLVWEQNELEKDVDEDAKFKIENIPAEKQIQFEEALNYLKSILPFEVADIETIANNLVINGIPYGAFINNVIYLNKAAKTGTEYHEAFHAVFSGLLTPSEKAKYLALAKKEKKVTKQDLKDLVDKVPAYLGKSEKELTDIVLEEYLADKYMDWKQKQSTTVFGKLFQKIKDIFNSIKDFLFGDVEGLFYKIDSGRFKHRPIKETSVPYFMALPYKYEKVEGEVVTRYMSSNEENKAIGTIFYRTAQYILEGNSIEEAYDKALEYIKSDVLEFSKNISDSDFADFYQKNYGFVELKNNKDTVYDTIKSKIQYVFAIDETIEDKVNTKEEEEGLGNFDRVGHQDVGLGSISENLRVFLSTVPKSYTDKHGYTTIGVVNPSKLYNSIGRTLLNTKPEDFIKKLEVYARDNEDTKYFLDYFKNLTNWNDEANQVGLDHEGKLKNLHIYEGLVRGFYKFKVLSLFTEIGDKVKSYNSNRKDVDVQQVEKWKVGYRNFLEKNYSNINPDKVLKPFNTKNTLTDEELDIEVSNLKTTLDTIGITLSRLYLEYSILKNRPANTDKQKDLIKYYEGFYGVNNNNNLSVILKYVNEQKDPFIEGDTGAYTRLKKIAEENAFFDESVGSSTFQNAEGELVGNSSLGSFFLKRTVQLQDKKSRATELEDFTEYYSNFEDNWLVPLHFISVKDNPLLKHEVTFDKDFEFSSIDGLKVNNNSGVTFKHMSPREKIITWMSLFTQTKKKTENGKEINYAYYYPQVIEAASTGYVVPLPVENFYDGKLSDDFYKGMFTFIKNEHERIQYVKNTNLPKIVNFNEGKNRGLTFTVNNYLSPEVVQELLQTDNIDNISSTLKKKIMRDIDTLIENQYKDLLILFKQQGITAKILPDYFKENGEISKTKLKLMLANYQLQVESLRYLMNGDLAYRVSNPEDDTKRAKGSNANYGSMYNEFISFKVIPDVEIKKSKVVTEDTIEFVEDKNGDEHNTTDAQSQSTLDFAIRRNKKLAKYTKEVSKLLDKLANNEELTRNEIETLEKNDALLNPKKDVAYGLNAYIKTSVLPLSKQLTSYLDNGEWKPLPHRAELHNTLEQMEAEGIDLTVYQSASKGTTVLNEKRIINGDNYGEQVSTKGVKTKITDGTQHLALIWSELPEDLQGLVEQLDDLDAERIVQSTEHALSLLKDGDVTTLKKVLPNWYNTLLATGASQQLLDIFKPDANGEPSLNPNISIAIDKFTALYMAHWSNIALKQKVNGSKFTLVSDNGFKILEDTEGNIVRTDQFDPTKEYKKPRRLKYNAKQEFKGKTVYYSECIISQYYKDLYNLKPNDAIPDELAFMLGYRIPTEDKASMVVLKVVDFLPATYGNTIIIPEEIQYLQGADFDVDSEFVQRYSTYLKDGKYIPYGTATTLEEQFDEFVNAIKPEVQPKYNEVLNDNSEYTKLKKEKEVIANKLSNLFEEKKQIEKNYEEDFRLLQKEIANVKEEFTGKELEEVLDEINTDISITEAVVDKQIKDLFNKYNAWKDFKNLAEIKEKLHRIETLALAKAIRFYGYPASKTAFKKKYPDGKFKEVLNNEMLTLKIHMLGDFRVQKELASEKTSNEFIKLTQEQLAAKYPKTFGAIQSQKGYFGFTDLAAAMVNNDAGKTGIGPAAVNNVVYQYLAKVNAFVDEAYRIQIKFDKNELTAKPLTYSNFRGFAKKGASFIYKNSANARIVKMISNTISAMTDNAKNPVSAKLNLNTETLGPVLMMINLGVPYETALKIVNTPIVKNLTQKLLLGRDSFTALDEKTFKLIQEAEDRIANLPDQVISETELDEYITDPDNFKGNPITYLAVYLKARTLANEIHPIREVLALRKGLGATFTEVNKAASAIRTLRDSKKQILVGAKSILTKVKPVQSLVKALQQLDETSVDLFISEQPEVKAVYEQALYTASLQREDEISKLYKDFNSYVTINIFKKYLNEYKDDNTRKYKNFIVPFREIFNKELLTEESLAKEVNDLKVNAKKYNLQNNRFLRYVVAKEKEEKNTIDSIVGNTRQLKDTDYQLELINGFDELYQHPKTKKTAMKLLAYILIKDGARYKNGSYQAEIPSYLFTVFSDSLNAFVNKQIKLDNLNEFIDIYGTKQGSKLAKLSEQSAKPLEGKIILDKEEQFIELGFATIMDSFLPKNYIKHKDVIYKIVKSEDNSFTYQTISSLYNIPQTGIKDFGISPYSLTFEENLELGKVLSKKQSEDDFEGYPTPLELSPELEPKLEVKDTGIAKGLKTPETNWQAKIKDMFKVEITRSGFIKPGEFTNYSGGASGSDAFWEKTGKEFEIGKQVNYRPEDLKRLTEEQIREIENAYKKAVAQLGRRELPSETVGGKLVRRDYLQAKAADAIYAIGNIIEPGNKDSKGYVNKTNKKIISGGTGYAVQMAINLNKTVFVFNQLDNTWWMYDNTKGEFGIYKTTPILTKKFAGIGTREITEEGKKAIKDVFETTFGEKYKILQGADQRVKDIMDNPETDVSNIQELYIKLANATQQEINNKIENC